MITDDFLPPSFLLKLAEQFLADNLDFYWSAFIALVPGFNQKVIETMRKAGCRRVTIGLESMSPRVLSLMGKPHTPELAEKIIPLFNKNGIEVHGTFIFGFPTETREEAYTTLNYIKHNIDLFSYVTMQQFSLEEDTLIYQNPEQFGLDRIHEEDKDYGFRLGYQFDVNSGMTQEESRLFLEEAIKSLKGKLNLFTR